MLAKQIVSGLYVIPLGMVNTFLIDADGLTLIDAGAPGSEAKILQAIQELGKQPTDIQQILITHAHPDHVGGLAALKALTKAPAYIHPLDAIDVRAGKVSRPLTPVPEVFKRILFELFIRRSPPTFPAATIEHEIKDGEVLPIAGGLQAIHVPGHAAGQLAFLWPLHNGILFAADTCSSMGGLGLSLGYEDLAEGKRSLAKLAKLDFAIACFGHGNAITQDAAAQFRKKWGKI